MFMVGPFSSAPTAQLQTTRQAKTSGTGTNSSKSPKSESGKSAIPKLDDEDAIRALALARDGEGENAKLAHAEPTQLVVMCFFKPNCRKCAKVNSFYESLVLAYPDVVFLDANVSRNLEAVDELSIKSVPTFVAFKNQREIGRYEGISKDAIEGLILAFN